MSDAIRAIFSRKLLINLVAAIVVLGLLVFGGFKWLGWYTDHGETITVPDLSGINYTQLQDKIKEYDLRVTIMDSVWDHESPKGVVLEQSPEPEDQVKRNRMIYVTVNAFGTEKVSIPNLEDLSERQAIAKIKSSKLRLGDVIYKPSEGCCYILGWNIKGKQLEPGTLVDRDTKIDLIVGMGMSKEMVSVPYLIGMTRQEAKEMLFNNSLTIGGEYFDEISVATREDSLKAKVYKQIPNPGKNSALLMGSGVTLYFTMDTAQIKVDHNLRDSMNVRSDTLAK